MARAPTRGAPSNMSSEISTSIIVCTRNRAASLRRTLRPLGELSIPAGWQVELLIVDNGSTDDTAAVARDARPGRLAVRYVLEPEPGKSRALNRAIAEARGEYLLFTDDDVAPRTDWVERMVTPMLNGACDAVNGQIILAPDLTRPWLTEMHMSWLALSLGAGSRDWARELIGANMGFRRAVLQRVPGYDPELGPGSPSGGVCEDTLLGMQLAAAGFRIAYVEDAIVVHHLDPSRLQRQHWLGFARGRGRNWAYIRYHWKHDDIRAPRLQAAWYAAKLGLRRRLQPPPALDAEGCPPWEMSYAFRLELCRQFVRERRRPRNYARGGLVKSLATP